MEKEFRIDTLKEESQNCAAGLGIEVERTINELEVADAAPVELVHCLQEAVLIEWPARLVQCREAEFTPEGTPA